jgi:hypothetical protein
MLPGVDVRAALRSLGVIAVRLAFGQLRLASPFALGIGLVLPGWGFVPAAVPGLRLRSASRRLSSASFQNI